MILYAKDKFLLKQVKQKGAKALYEAYLHISDGSNTLVCEKSISYLKMFVQYEGHFCEGIIRSVTNEPFSLTPWGDEYLRLLTIIAAYHLDRNEILTGLFWAKKAIDLFGYFNPVPKSEAEWEIVRNMSATSMICSFPHHFDEDAYDHFLLDWEVERFYYCGNISHFNDN